MGNGHAKEPLFIPDTHTTIDGKERTLLPENELPRFAIEIRGKINDLIADDLFIDQMDKVCSGEKYHVGITINKKNVNFHVMGTIDNWSSWEKYTEEYIEFQIYGTNGEDNLFFTKPIILSSITYENIIEGEKKGEHDWVLTKDNELYFLGLSKVVDNYRSYEISGEEGLHYRGPGAQR